MTRIHPFFPARLRAKHRAVSGWLRGLVVAPLLAGLSLPRVALRAAEPALLPANATVASGDLTVTLPGEGWQQLEKSEGKIGAQRSAGNRVSILSIWPMDPSGDARKWTAAQHTKAYFGFERTQARAPGTKWTGFAESVRTIKGSQFPAMTFQILGRQTGGAASVVDGAFLLIFPQVPLRPGRFYVAMWTETYLKQREKFDWRDFEAAIGSLSIGPPPASPASFENALAKLERAKGKLGAKDFAGALADFDAVIASDPKSSDAFGGRGVAKLALGDTTGGMTDLDRAIELNDAAIPAYFVRGQVKAGRQDMEGAIRDFSKVLVLDPNHAGALYQRSAAKARSRDLAGAIQDLSRLIELQPANPNTYYTRGTLHRDSGNLDQAIADLSKAIELKPDYANAYNNRGAARRSNGDLKGALADFDQAIALNPQDHFALNNRAGAKEELKDYTGALADLDAAIRLKPDWVGGYLSRGTMKKNRGDNAGAIVDLTEAIRLQPANAQAYAIRAAAKSDSGDAEGAKEDRERATALSQKK